MANNNGVFPSSAKESACILTDSLTNPCEAKNVRLPPNSSAPSMLARSPCPGKASNSSTSLSSIPSAAAVTAFAKGCSLFFSRDAANCISSLRSLPIGITSVTTGSPSVNVPVLSIATIRVLPAVSNAAAVLYRIPFPAATPLPTITATGVANPSAQGQLITSTEIPRAMAKAIVSPTISQPAKVNRLITSTAGTNTPDTLSAIRASGAFVAAASETVRMICARVVSSPTRVALHSI